MLLCNESKEDEMYLIALSKKPKTVFYVDKSKKLLVLLNQIKYMSSLTWHSNTILHYHCYVEKTDVTSLIKSKMSPFTYTDL